MRIVRVNKSPTKKTYKIANKIGIGALVIGLFVTAISFKIVYIGNEPAKPNDNIVKQALLSAVKPTPIRAENVSRGVETDRMVFEYDLTKLTCSPHIARIIREQTDRIVGKNDPEITQEFFEAVYCIVGYESQFNPKCEVNNKREHSIGLLQVNTRSNYPKNADKNKLRDATFNLQYQLPELYDYYCRGKSSGKSGELLIQYVSKHGQRADWSDPKVKNYIIKAISKYYAEIKAARIN